MKIMSKKDRRKIEEKNIPEKPIEKELPDYVYLKGTAYNSSNNKESQNIQIKNFDLSAGNQTHLLRDAEINLIFKQKYGIIGRNGIGKSVLMRTISKREYPFDKIPNSYTTLMVEQEILVNKDTPLTCVLKADREREWLLQTEKLLLEEQEPDQERSYDLQDIYERLSEIDANKAESRARAILNGLGFLEDEVDTKPSKEYSGGWQMRIALARALFIRPALLILDEPTNHLDLHASIWLENYLENYPYTILLVSHDESFLDTVVNNIIHFINHKLIKYKGNWSSFIKQRENLIRELEQQKKSLEVKEKELKKIIQKNGTTQVAKQAKIKLDTITKEKEETIEKLIDDNLLTRTFEFPKIKSLTETALLQFKNVKFGYNYDNILFNNIDFGIYHDSKIGLVGANGVGKTTIMNLMLGELKPLEGEIISNPHLRFGRFSQHHVDQLDMEKTPIEYLQIIDSFQSINDIRRHLGKFGISGNTALQKIKFLSGGQKSRIAFAGAAFKSPHIMLLDEPSNHLDLYAIKALVDGLKKYEGSLVIISHNQKLIEECCNELWIVHKNGKIKRFDGSFKKYKENIIQNLIN